MTTGVVFNLQGLGDLLEKLARKGEDVDAAANKALQAGADLMLTEMQLRVPILSGNLLKHIQIKGPQQNGNWVEVEVGVIHDINYTDADTATYGNVQEYGSATNRAQPYIRPAIDSAKGTALQAMKSTLNAELER